MTTEMPGTEAELLAAYQKGMSLPRYRVWRAEQATREAPRARALPDLAPAPNASISIVLPFEILCPDNDKFGVIANKMINTRRYRRAKKAIRAEAQRQYDGPLLECPVALVARVWFPTENGDAPNFGKAVHDALETVIYPNDKLLHDARWKRAGIDVDRPRAELTITTVIVA